MNTGNLLRHISLKRIRLQKVHTLMTVAGICLGVAAIVSIGIVNKSVMRSFEDTINRVTGRAVLQVTGSAAGFPEGLVEEVQTVPGVTTPESLMAMRTRLVTLPGGLPGASIITMNHRSESRS